ncbi:MAG: NAD(P)-dependent alcohol dehydrogenase [Deltaproteobacteria bacterium]|nr:NAD(P)-dependent alcohol dehydrogenase [Deltaproteobacteria bacterium]
MKVYELVAREGFDALSLAERPTPKVRAGEVKVRVRAVSLNYRDLVVAKGAKNRATPIVPASDGAGEVIEVGEGVSTLAVGDRVAASFFPTWLDGPLSDAHHAAALGGGQDGMLAEEVVLPASAWVRMPAHLSFEQGATLPCAGVTAHHALFEAATVTPGDVVLLQGTGGVSVFALQLAKAAGARVVMTSSSAAKRDLARSLGADHVIDYRADAKWGESARAWAGGRGVDLVVDVGGPGTLDQSIAALRYGGTVSLLGVLTGTRGDVNTYGIFHKTLRVAGIYVGSVAMFERFVRALDAAKIAPVVDRVFAFDEARAAYEHLASATHFGKVVIRV